MVGVGIPPEHAEAIVGIIENSITATGSSQDDAYAIKADVTFFSTVAASTGAIIPSALPSHSQIWVFNGGANDLAIYPPSGCTINDGSANASVNIPAGEGCSLIRVSTTVFGCNGCSSLSATTTEINRVADVSTRLVSVGGETLSVTEATHDGKIILLDVSDSASTCTLPAASGSGALFRFIVSAVNTNNHVIKVANADDTIDGSVNILDNDSNAQTAYAASGTDDTITLNGTTTGGQIGDWIELVDIAANQWAVRGQLVCPAGSNVADMFSATVS